MGHGSQESGLNVKLGQGLLGGSGDLVSSSLIMGIIRVTIWVIGLSTCLVSPPDPPSRVWGLGFRMIAMMEKKMETTIVYRVLYWGYIEDNGKSIGNY